MIWVNWITEGRIQWLVRIKVNEARQILEGQKPVVFCGKESPLGMFSNVFETGITDCIFQGHIIKTEAPAELSICKALQNLGRILKKSSA